MGQDIGSLRWFIDNTEVVQYVHAPGDESRLPFNVDGSFEIISVQSSTTSDNINVTSTFATNTSVLEGLSNIQCGTRGLRSNNVTVNVSVLGK
jgi:hypothetical protein